MRIYTFSNNTAKILKRFTKEQGWMHLPSAEPKFKKEPYLAVYLENTPKKDQVTVTEITLKEIKKFLKKHGN